MLITNENTIMTFNEFLFNNYKALFIKFNWKLKLNNNEKDNMLVASRIYKNQSYKLIKE